MAAKHAKLKDETLEQRRERILALQPQAGYVIDAAFAQTNKFVAAAAEALGIKLQA